MNVNRILISIFRFHYIFISIHHNAVEKGNRKNTATKKEKLSNKTTVITHSNLVAICNKLS